ncbi:NAD(P)H-dependent oxidoreductase [Sphingomonas sp. MS122]|uniref:NAD(P)H-dependent oxidoreductase n=1 Tax=Sphingomonas sp. MS122 TaxID=3412683 RepID=UPI003C2D3348
MRNLVVISHPDPNSLTHAVANAFASGLRESDAGVSVEIADLAAEGFDPRQTARDLAAHLLTATPAAAILAEQARIDRADRLVLVYPVYWWSFPALLKGWIDRVFTNGWAYGYTEGDGRKKLGRLEVVLIAVGGTDAGTYARHGYFGAMRTQIDHGIFDYCGARVVRHELLFDSHGPDQQANLDIASRLGRSLGQRRAA